MVDAAGSRLESALEGRALAVYLPLGDPAAQMNLAEIYAESGVDIFEIGIPSKNPYLDGGVVRESMQRALDAGTDLNEATRLTAIIRRNHPNQAMVWMSYPSEALGHGFVDFAAKAGVDGVLVPSPPSALQGLRERLIGRGIELLPFVGERPTEEDIKAAGSARGYAMVQAAPGVTGMRDGVPATAKTRIRELQERVGAPLLLGFGISTANDVKSAIAAGADGVVVGTAAVLAAVQSEADIRWLLLTLRRALDDA